jgi:hypothetical protein
MTINKSTVDFWVAMSESSKEKSIRNIKSGHTFLFLQFRYFGTLTQYFETYDIRIYKIVLEAVTNIFWLRLAFPSCENNRIYYQWVKDYFALQFIYNFCSRASSAFVCGLRTKCIIHVDIKTTGSNFITLSYGTKEMWRDFHSDGSKGEKEGSNNNNERRVDRFVKEGETRQTQTGYHLPGVSHTSQVAQYGFHHVLTKDISN